MGCGKSTVGKILADSLGRDFVDLDLYVEHKKGMSIPRFIEAEGEEAFRMIEADCIRDIVTMSEIRDRDVVVALGGGTLATTSVQKLILDRTLCIHLKASFGTICDRIGKDTATRPLFRNMEAAAALYAERLPIYGKAPVTIDTDGLTPEETARKIKLTI